MNKHWIHFVKMDKEDVVKNKKSRYDKANEYRDHVGHSSCSSVRQSRDFCVNKHYYRMDRIGKVGLYKKLDKN